MTLNGAAIAALVDKKRRGGDNSRDEIEAVVRGFTRGTIDDEAMAAWLKAVFLSGMTFEETADLTRAMAESGDRIDWSGIPGPIVDKHSTGGVGDVVSLIAVPAAAACGIKVAKLSGRALGHTGGTLDKLECIPGLRTELSIEAFKAQVAGVGCAIAAASATLAPADKKMYALRERTGTVASVPLIAASVMSKKIAGGAPAIVLDVKVGTGAFMRTLDEATELARVMVEIGARLGRRVRVVLTAMDEPLAESIGDALELDEALRVLEGGLDSRLVEVAIAVTEAMLDVAGTGRASATATDPRATATSSVAQARPLHLPGAALRCFKAMVEAQGGRLDAFDRRFVASFDIRAPAAGYVTHIDARALGEAVAQAKSSVPREAAHRVGMRIKARVGARVRRGDILAECFADNASLHVPESAFTIGSQAPPPRPVILGEM